MKCPNCEDRKIGDIVELKREDLSMICILCGKEYLKADLKEFKSETDPMIDALKIDFEKTIQIKKIYLEKPPASRNE